MKNALTLKIAIRSSIVVGSLIAGCTYTQPVLPDDAPTVSSWALFSQEQLIRIVPVSLNTLRTHDSSDTVWFAIALDTPGYLLTAAHILSGSVAVTFVDIAQNQYTARNIRFHPAIDIALVQLTTPLITAPSRSHGNTYSPQPGSVIHTFVLSGSTMQQISWHVITVEEKNTGITTSLPLLPGMSGAPVVDSQGNRIGINKSRVSADESEIVRLTSGIRDRIEETIGKQLDTWYNAS